MKALKTKRAAALETPVFPQTLHQLRPTPAADDPVPKPAKRQNIFSKSRDTREDRGTCEMKTKHNPQTNFRSGPLL
jgi:hypothetical protein